MPDAGAGDSDMAGVAFDQRGRIFHPGASDSAVRHLSRVEALYRLFLFHQLQWVTVNAPYLFKLFDMELIDGTQLRFKSLRGLQVSGWIAGSIRNICGMG